jgi:hypothetical protein
MANDKHLDLLFAGVESWNLHRLQNEFKPDFSGADLVGQEFSEFDLRNANFQDAYLNGANFSNADLQGANFQNATLDRANFTGANMISANLKHAKFFKSTLEKASLWGADLDGAIFRAARLKGANFMFANISTASFEGSQVFESTLPYLHGFIADNYLSAFDADQVQEIKTTSAFIKKLGNLDVPNGARLYFRGEASTHSGEGIEWTLTPKVLRNSLVEKNEAKLLTEFFTREPSAIGNPPSTFSELVFAQHYGLATRLLDVSRNPLVALYNACETDKENDGRIHIFLIPEFLRKSYQSDTVSVLANFAKLATREQDAILTKPRSGGIKSAYKRLYHFIKTEKPHFQELINPTDFFTVFLAEPKRDFPRLQAQSGAFLISAFHKDFEPSKINNLVKSAPTYIHRTLTVKAQDKAVILEELKLLNISRETLYPSFAESAAAVNESIQ